MYYYQLKPEVQPNVNQSNAKVQPLADPKSTKYLTQITDPYKFSSALLAANLNNDVSAPQ